MKNIIILFVVALLLFVACQEDTSTKKTSEQATKEVKKMPKVPTFERDSAFEYVKIQTEFGPRVPNSAAHQAAKNWLVNQLKSFGAEVIEQNFKATAYTKEVLNATNIIGQYNPKAKNRIILAAHWDSRHTADHDPDEANHKAPVMGADDGASGVGVLLEIARQLQLHPIDLGVDIILFDVEDYGDGGEDGDYTTWCLGSQYWSKNPHVSGYTAKYGVLLDMVGAKGARFTKEEISMRFAPKLMNDVWSLAQAMGYGNYFVNTSTRQYVDDHFFVNQIAKIPMGVIINRPPDTETLFVKHWHTVEDTIDKIDPRTLRAVGQVLLATIYRDDAGLL